jgi:hypothetical protein
MGFFIVTFKWLLCPSYFLVLPVLQPTLIKFPEQAVVDIDQMTNVSIQSEVLVGLGAQVYWLSPNGTIVEEYYNTTEIVDNSDKVYVIASNLLVGEYEQIVKRTLVIDDTDDIETILLGEYALVINDTGYGDQTVYEEHTISIGRFSSSSVHSISHHVSITSQVPRVTETPPSAPPHQHNIPLIIALCVSGMFLILSFVVISLIITIMVYLKHYKRKSKINDTVKGNSVTYLADAKTTNLLFFSMPSSSANNSIEISRDQIIFIESLGQ